MNPHSVGIVLLAVTLHLGVANSQPPPPNSRPIYPPGQPHGVVGQLIVDVLPVPQSLKQLTDMSSLIVEGVVEKVMPSRGDGNTWIETDSVINIAQTFKGSIGGSAIVIAQMGGEVADVTSQPTQYSLVQPGERFILFLSPDDRKALPSIAGLKRYDVTAAWAGLLLVGADGLIHTDPKYDDPLRKRYEGKSKVEMIDLLEKAITSTEPPEPAPSPFPGGSSKKP
jgi:hypothetical protein